MRDLVYLVATSLDGRIAAPDGDAAGFPAHPDTLAALFDRYPETCPAHLRDALGVTSGPRRFDTVVMGARTHQPAVDAGLTSAYPHLRQVVVSHRDLPVDPGMEVVAGDVRARVAELKAEAGDDIWLCGGADLAGTLLDLVDEVQVKVNPVLFGDGLPLARTTYAARPLRLVGSEALPGDVVLLTYRRAPRAT